MKNKIIFSGLIISLIISLVVLPVMSNPILTKDIIDINRNNAESKGYYFCRVDISGVGEYHDEVPIFIGWNLTEGQLTIKSMFSTSSNFPNFPYKLFDKYNTSEPTNGILMLFIGTKTNEPFEIHGFAALVIIN